MDTITITIDGVEVETTKGKRILEAALDAGIYIPNLCALRDISLPTGACRICQVQIEGKRGTVTACSEPAADGMVIHNNTPELNAIRRNILEIMLAKHPSVCLTCHRRKRCVPGDICLRLAEITEEQCILCPNNNRCELQRVVDFIGIKEVSYPYKSKGLPIERDNPFIVRNNNLCILCGRCVRVCQEVLGIEAIAFNQRGIQTFIGGAFGQSLMDSGCIFCGSCVEVCPTGALKDYGDEWERWNDPKAASIRCRYACPAMVDVPRFIRHARQKQFEQATAVIRESVPFAHLCSLICEHPCENACRRNDLDEGLAIRALERYCVENTADYNMKPETTPVATGKKIAIIGAGPAGLTAAYYLSKLKGHSVTVFESQSQAGGMMRQIVPEFRLPREILDREIARLKETGIEITTDRSETVENLPGEKYDVVLVATGVADSTDTAIEGANETGILDGIEFLRQHNSGNPVEIGKKVIVIGDGTLAIYAARTARRIGAATVAVLTTRAQNEMLKVIEGVKEAQEEGIVFKSECTPLTIVKSKGHLSLTFRPTPVTASTRAGKPGALDADTVIMAMEGIHSLDQAPGAANGVIKTGENTFCAGSIVSGKVSFIESIAAGRNAAIQIDNHLGGNASMEEMLTPVNSEIPKVGRMSGFSRRKRNNIPCLETSKRITNFKQVEQGFDSESGSAEANRCMNCDLRFYVARMTSTSRSAEETSTALV